MISQIKNAATNFRHVPKLKLLICAAVAITCVGSGPITPSWGQTGSIEVDFADEETGESLVCRVRLLGSNGKPIRARGVVYHKGWSLIEGTLKFKGPVGNYTYRAFHGPQYAAASGGFTLDKRSTGIDIVNLPRHADVSSEGWIGGDLLSFVSKDLTCRWMPAEELDLAVVVGSNQGDSEAKAGSQDGTAAGRWIESNSYRDSRPGSGIVLHHWQPPAAVPDALPSSRLLVMAKQAEVLPGGLPVHAEIQRMWARDVPIWLASNWIDSIQLLSEHLTYDGEGATKLSLYVDPAPGRFRGKLAAGKQIELLYWQVLEAGLRIPPTAGSGFGKSNSPLGYNRVYALLGSRTENSWWQAIRDGRSFVTSGPLLRVAINASPPGTVFDIREGEKLQLNVALTLTVSDPVDYLDVIFNGKTLYQARLDEYAKNGGKIPELEVTESGWIVVRVVTQNEDTYRIASTAPYYVQIDGQRRISKSAVEFFQKWLEEARADLARIGGESAVQAAPYLHAAEEFWSARLERANAN